MTENPALESLTMLSMRLQEKIWRSPERKKFNVAFIADMLLMDRTTAEGISLGRQLVNADIADQGSDDWIDFFMFCRLLRSACRYHNGKNDFNTDFGG